MGVNWLKTIFLVLLSSFIGIMSNPDILTASDSVAVVDLDKSSIVETVSEPDKTDVSAPIAKAPSAGVVKTEPALAQAAPSRPAQAKPAASQPAPEPELPANRVTFAWGSQALIRTNTTSTNSGKNVAMKGTLIWGHNWTDFGKITSLKLGDTFTITENGMTSKYKIVPNPIDGKAGVALDMISSTNLSYAKDPRFSSISMGALVNHGFGGHSLVLMTCYGSNGRYVVVADKI